MEEDVKLEHREDSAEKVRLATFVEKNQKLLSVVGVFTALVIFSLNLPLKPVGYVTAFFFFGASALLWVEVLRLMPPEELQEWSLRWFRLSVSFGSLALIAFWFLEFRGMWRFFLPLILMIPAAAIIERGVQWLTVKFRLKERLATRVYAYGFACLIVVLALVISSALSSPINRVLDSMRKDIVKLMEQTVTESSSSKK